ncbi:MAG: 23S rRNA (adenine(2503)-C(2))-methyltransferase RlmN [Chloroflexota bacterium]|nr:MAG: putative dual-specificity RNA methyltransferase RlmN [Bellilinea sp.]
MVEVVPLSSKPLIYDIDYADLEHLIKDWQQPSFRTRQIWEGLYKNYWRSPEEFTNLPVSLRNQLANTFRFVSLEPIQVLHSSDRETTKTLFNLPDGKAIEAVLMKYEKRRTLCISTQSGCAMGCVFCATGQMGFKRNLTSGEIVEQVIYYANLLHKEGESVTNIVLMGMGEPFHNYEATMAAIDRLNHPFGMNLGARRFTISTVGLIPMIRRFAAEQRQINLAISLHAADDELRTSMLPVNKKYPLDELMAACRDYVAQTRRRITFEWALIQNVNDSVETARKLARLLEGLLCHVNVIPLNPTKKYTGKGSTRERAMAFKAELERNGIPCTIRIRRGIDIQAGCGQLAIQQDQNSPPNPLMI